MNRKKHQIFMLVMGAALITGCIRGKINVRPESTYTPGTYGTSADSMAHAVPDWKKYFSDPHLVALIDTALSNNQELNIFNQELEMRKNEIKSRRGEYLPFVNLNAGAGMEKTGRYTRNGAVEEQLEIKPGQSFPEPLPDYLISANASWEIDIWKKLRNAKKSAVMQYLAGKEGKNLLITNLVSEIAVTYYELISLDNLLKIIEQNIEIQSNAFTVVSRQKDAGRVSQLAVNRFEAQLLNTKNLKYEVMQHIVEAENRINFLTGRFPAPIERYKDDITRYSLSALNTGVPTQLLSNRPDIKQAELELAAAKLDVKVAKARFYPSVRLSAGVGYQAFSGEFLFHPGSLLYNFAGDLVSPLVNRNAIMAMYRNANAAQLQAVIRYEQSILNGYTDVLNQLRKIDNYSNSLGTKNREVEILNESVGVANSLYMSARADYAEVLLTQREALEAKLQLIEIKQKQLLAQVNMYRALGGGWH